MKFKIGDDKGFNPSVVYDASGNGVCQFYGVPLNTHLSKVHHDKLKMSREVVKRVNLYEGHVQFIAALAKRLKGITDSAKEVTDYAPLETLNSPVVAEYRVSAADFHTMKELLEKVEMVLGNTKKRKV